MKTITLRGSEADTLIELLEETEALIDADDGTLFPLRYLNLFDEVKELVQYNGTKDND